jgi:ElaA protein
MSAHAAPVSPPSGFVWQWFDFHALTLDQLYAILRLRQDVFIIEQQSIYPDLDGLDFSCRHLLMCDESGNLVAYLRAGQTLEAIQGGPQRAFIGRVIVAPRWRGKGMGRAMMIYALAALQAQWPEVPVNLSAQLHVQDFYMRLGFTPYGAIYDDGGIPHIAMQYQRSR